MASLLWLTACSPGNSSLPEHSDTVQFVSSWDATGLPSLGDFGTGRSGNLKGCAHFTSLVYISSYAYQHTVSVYDEKAINPHRCGVLGPKSGLRWPWGLFVDAHEDVWLANSFAYNVLEFARGATQAKLVLSDPSGVPVDVAVNEKTGSVYVANYESASGGDGSIEVYDKNQTMPSRELSDSRMQRANWLALDDQGNVYVVVTTQPYGNSIFEWVKGRGKARDLDFYALGELEGLRTTTTGALATCRTTFPKNECGYVPPRSHALTVAFMASNVRQIALNSMETSVFTLSDAGGALQWNWPGPDGGPVNSFSDGVIGLDTWGIAVSPASPPGAPY